MPGPQRPNPPKKSPKKKAVAPKQTASLFGLTDVNHPFQGLTGTPARDTKVSDLTAQVALARARKQRLEQGGLLTPAQQQAEQRAAVKAQPRLPNRPKPRKSGEIVGGGKDAGAKGPLAASGTKPRPESSKDESRVGAVRPPVPERLSHVPVGLLVPVRPVNSAPNDVGKPTNDVFVSHPKAKASAPFGFNDSPLSLEQTRSPSPILGVGKGRVVHWDQNIAIGAPYGPRETASKNPAPHGFNAILAYANAHPKAATSGNRDLTSLGGGESWKTALANVGKNVLEPAHRYADMGVATTLSGLASIPGTLLTPPKLGETHTPVEDVKATSSTALAQRIALSGMKAPDINIPIGSLSFAGTAYAGAPPSAKVPFADLRNQTGWDIKPAYGKQLNAAAKKRGWHDSDLENISATERIFKAYNDPPGLVTRLLKGGAQDVVLGGSQTVGALGLASEIAQGRGVKAGEDLFNLGRNLVPGVGDHPWVQTFETHPVYALTALHAGIKSAGAAGHALPGITHERIVPIAGTENLAGEKETINRGMRSKNLVTAVAQQAEDFGTSHLPGRRAAALRHDTDEMVRTQRDEHAREHADLQVPQRVNTYHLPDERATELMAWKDFGGKPGLQNAVTHYTREAAGGNAAAANLLGKVKAALERPPSTKDEHAFVESLGAISEHTSDIRQDLGFHGATAQLFRKYESPIEMAAENGDHLAIAAREARHEVENLRENDPTRFSIAASAKIAEVGRDVKRHTKKAAPTVEEWRAQGKQIRKEKPKLREGASERQIADHQVAMKQWKQRLAAHQRQGGRVAAHTTEVRQQGRRLDKLTAKQREQLPYEEQVQVARQHYENATQAFVDSHHSAGGVEPARIARSQPKSGILHPRRTAGLFRATLKADREHFSSGETVRRGQYIYDTRAPLHENAEIQRIRGHVGIWNALAQHPMVEHAVGDGELKVPAGKVAVPESNFRSAARTTPAWEDVPSASMASLDREHGLRSKLVDALKGVSKVEGEVIPKGQAVFLLPKDMHQRVIEWAKPHSKDGKIAAYERANAAYQRILIGIYPSTWLGNAPGSVPLAIASGAIPGRGAYKLAAQSGEQGLLSNKLGYQKDRGLAPSSVQGVGPAGLMAHHDESLPMRVVGKGRQGSVLGENFSARAAYFGQVKPVVEGYLPRLRKMAPAVEKVMPKRWKGKAHELNVETTALYHALASGKWDDGARISPELDKIRNQAIDHTTEFMSGSVKPKGDIGRLVGSVVLFHNWLGHILKLTLVSLPLHHPRRALLLDSISLYGNQYRQEHGVYPSWMVQFLPFLRMPVNGAPGVLSAGLGQLTPISSAGNLANVGTQLDTGDPMQLATGLVSPLLQPFIKAAQQIGENNTNKSYEQDYSPGNVLLAGILRAAPGSSKFITGIGGGGGYAPGSNPITGMQKRKYYEYVLNSSGKSYKRYEIPWSMRPGGRAVGGLLGEASRVVGLPLEWNPTGGAPLGIEQGNQQVIQQALEAQRELKAAKK